MAIKIKGVTILDDDRNLLTGNTISASSFVGPLVGNASTATTLTTPAMIQGTDIPSGADLNTYTVTGLYHQNLNSNAAAGFNYPAALAGMLEVMADGSMVYQRYTIYSSGIIYTRSYFSTTWYSWQQLITDSATQSISGVKTFTGIPAFNGGTSGSSAPFTVDSTTIVTNLNADLVDGVHGSSFLRSDSDDSASGFIAFDRGANTYYDAFSIQSGTIGSGNPGLFFKKANPTEVHLNMWNGSTTEGLIKINSSSFVLNSTTAIIGLDGTNGYVSIQKGNTTNPGYLGFHSPNGTRRALLGWNNGLNRTVFAAENGWDLAIEGNTYFDTTTLVVDSKNNRVGIGTSTPNSTLAVVGDTELSGAVSVVGNASVTGDLYFNNALIASDAGASNIDHIWHDDATNTWNFISDSTYKSTGNSILRGSRFQGPADTLTTSRTLWGQSFNGSANVSGNLTSVGDITGSSAVTIAAGGTNQNITLTPTGTGTVNAPTFKATSVTNGGFQGIDADSATQPSFTWASDQSTGVWHPGSYQIGLTTNGTNRVLITNGGITMGAGSGFKHSSEEFYTWQTRLEFDGSEPSSVWKKIVTINTFSDTYSGITFQIDVINPGSNYGTPEVVSSVTKATYYVTAIRSRGILNDTNSCAVSGPGTMVRAIRTATGVFEIHVQSPGTWKELQVAVKPIVNNGAHTISYHDLGATIGTAQATYTATATAAALVEQNIITNSLTVSDTINGSITGNADTVDLLHASSFLRSDAPNSSDVRLASTNGRGLRFWDSDSYKIWMSAATDATYGGRISGDTNSDYNMYHRIAGGTNRGFVFETDYATKLFSINPNGVRSAVAVTAPVFLGTDADTESQPSFTWPSDQNTGVYRPAADQVGLATGGLTRLIASNAGVSIYSGNLYIPDVLYHDGDTSTFVRFPSANTIQLATSGTSRLQILPAGDIGIGTTTPSTKLHVYGTGQTTANLTDAGANDDIIKVSGTGSAAGTGGAIAFSSQQGDVAGSLGFAAIKGLLKNGSNNTVGDLTISTRNLPTDTSLSERIRITYDGNVGINVGSPATKLNIVTTKVFDPSNGKDSGIFVQQAGGIAGMNNLSAGISFSKIDSFRPFGAIVGVQTSSDADQGGLAFFVHPNATTLDSVSEAMRLDHSGNLSIGSDTPITKLTVMQGDDSTSYKEVAAFSVSNSVDDSQFSTLAFGQMSTNTMFLEARNQSNAKGDLVLQPYAGNVRVGSNFGVGAIPIAPAGFNRFVAIGDSDTGIGQISDGILALATNNAERIRILANGSVGIGTSTVTAKLNVEGNAVVNGLISGTAVIQGALDTTTNRLMTVGAAGWLRAQGVYPPEYSFDTWGSSPSGAYWFNNVGDAGPAGLGYGTAIALNYGDSRQHRIVLNAGASDMWIGYLDSTGVQGTWSKIFGQKNILGTVSQSSGIPTGGLIERGSNGNGGYVRFADGTQICWGAEQLGTASTASGSVFVSNGLTFSFPAAFVSAPTGVNGAVALSSRWVSGAAAQWSGTGADVTATQVACRFIAAVSGSQANVSYIAIGRWF